ncbi:MAG: HAD family phosphatase [Pseudomonadota bacterium]
MTAGIVLFDLGNVVLDWDPLRLYLTRFENTADAQAFCREVCTLEWHTHHDRGVSFSDNAAPLIAQYPQYEDHIQAWRTQWLDMFHGYVAGVPALMARLEEARVPLFGLSNLSAEIAAETFDAYPIIKLLRDVVVSGAEGVVKPDLRIYEIALERMGSPDPADVFFIDDREDNIRAAETIGMRGHVFENAAGLEVALVQQGIL